MGNFQKIKARAARIKSEIHALYLAARDPRTPWYAKLVVAGVVTYALSPIDLIPDFIPVLGHLDDLLLIPLGIILAVKLIPKSILDDCRARAKELGKLPTSRAAGVAIIIIWAVLVVFILVAVIRAIGE